MKYYIGIDPGKNGGLCLLSENKEIIDYCRMPDTINEIADFFKKAKKYKHIVCVLEQVSARPGQGVCSMFTFGKGVGQLEMVVVANSFNLYTVTPQKWKKVMLPNNANKSDKKESIKQCKKLLPNINLIPIRCRVEHDGIAEAALLALYGIENNF